MRVCGRRRRHPGRLLESVLLLLVLATAAPTCAGEPTEQVKAGIDRLAALARDPTISDSQRQAQVQVLLPHWFDVPEMAKRSLAGHWPERTPEEQQEFIELFESLFATLVAEHLAAYPIRYVSEAVNGSSATVTILVLTRPDPTPVVFALLRGERGWAAYDVKIEDVSLLSTYRARFGQVILTHSYEDLVSHMRRQLASSGLQPTGHSQEASR